MAKDWDLLGEELLLHGDSVSAENAFLEAFRYRTLFHDRDLRFSPHAAFLVAPGTRRSTLCGCAHESNPLVASDGRTLADVADRVHPGPYSRGFRRPSWRSYLFQDALTAARDFQQNQAMSGHPSEYAQQRLKQISLRVIKSSLATDKLGLAGFQATEEDRAAVMRQKFVKTGVFLKKTSPEYWSTLSWLRAAQTEEIAGKDARSRITLLRRELANLENSSGLSDSRSKPINIFERNTAQNALSTIQQGLTSDEALLSFHVGGDVSALWAVTRGRVELYRLPPESQLVLLHPGFPRCRPAAVWIATDWEKFSHRQLFGGLSPEFLAKRAWVVSAEDSFFEFCWRRSVAGWSGTAGVSGGAAYDCPYSQRGHVECEAAASRGGQVRGVMGVQFRRSALGGASAGGLLLAFVVPFVPQSNWRGSPVVPESCRTVRCAGPGTESSVVDRTRSHAIGSQGSFAG